MEIQTTEKNPVKAYFAREDVRKKIEELMHSKSTGFITSLLSLVNSSQYLQKAKPETILTSAMMAATLDLPINSNLGFAYIIPYNDRDNGQIAQFQLGYRGLIQLALRSGQFKTISACPVYEGQLVEENPLTGFVFDWKQKKSEKIIGYAAYFSLINGFEKTDFRTVEQIQEHGKRFSKTFSAPYGIWKKDFDAMATKTVLKLLLAKYAPLSVEMQRAVIADQGVIKEVGIDVNTIEVDYVDEGNDNITVEELQELYELKVDALTPEEKEHAEKTIKNQISANYTKLHNLLKNR